MVNGGNMKTRFYNAYVITCNDNFDIFPNGEVWVDEDTIVYAGESKDGFMADRKVNCFGDIIMPGFINSHAHLPMQIFRGLAEGTSFGNWWNDQIKPLEKNFTSEQIYWSTMLAIAESVRGGTTCVLNNYFVQDTPLKAFEESGMRGAIHIDVRYGLDKSRRRHDWENRYAQLNKSNPLITFFVSSHSIFSLDEDGLTDCTYLAKKYKLPQTIHLCETLQEVGTCEKETGKSPVKYLEDLGFWDYPATVAHGIYVDKEDIKIFKKHNVNVSINMSSNLKLADGIAPIYSYMQQGVSLSLGTDSVASNNRLDMFKEMFLASVSQKVLLKDATVVTARDVLLMATRGGAKALFLEDQIGQLTDGYQADIIRISLSEPHWQPQNDLISHLVYSAMSSDVAMTMVAGKILYENGSYYIGNSLKEIYENCNISIKTLLTEVNKENNIK